MKTNDPHDWIITLSGAPNKKHIEQADFIGTSDEALARADEFECEVPFDVIQYVITRGPKK